MTCQLLRVLLLLRAARLLGASNGVAMPWAPSKRTQATSAPCSQVSSAPNDGASTEDTVEWCASSDANRVRTSP